MKSPSQGPAALALAVLFLAAVIGFFLWLERRRGHDPAADPPRLSPPPAPAGR